jgi:hypothetical protein
MNRNIEINEIAKSVILHAYYYDQSSNLNIAIKQITITFNDDTEISLCAKADIDDLFTVFTDINREYDVLHMNFEINDAICNKIIYSISFSDESEFTDTLNGYYISYNKITIHYGNNELYEFYILQSSNGIYCGYFIIE